MSQNIKQKKLLLSVKFGGGKLEGCSTRICTEKVRARPATVFLSPFLPLLQPCSEMFVGGFLIFDATNCPKSFLFWVIGLDGVSELWILPFTLSVSLCQKGFFFFV